MSDAILVTKKLRRVSHGISRRLLDMRRNRDGTNRAASQVHVSRPYDSATARLYNNHTHVCKVHWSEMVQNGVR